MNLLMSLLRAAPAIVFSISLIVFIVTRLDVYLLLSILITVGEAINKVLKHYIFKPIMNDKYVPILGYGRRPINSKNPAQFGDINNPPYKGSYGMPSGHSQTTITFAVFLIMALFDYHLNLSNSMLYFITFIISIYSIMVLWSRIYLKCHTIQQVIIGSIIGAMLGYYGYIYGKLLIKPSN
jgi:membrane-associated phospholipid phosphatase